MIEYFKRLYKWMRTDGLLHASFSALLVLSLNTFLPFIVALALTAVVGVMKELYDNISGKGFCEYHDIECNAIGMVYATLIVLLSHIF